MRIYHNIPALNAYNQLNSTQNALANSIKKLASGLRINGAADDAAGLAISEKMRAQIKGLDVATRNAQDGISLIQTAEGALESTNSILQRMRELSVQAANDTLTQQDREYIQLEVNQLRDEIDRIANSTQFNKKKLLNGSASVLWSSDSLDTKLFVKGGLRQIDQFGQKLVAEGNYKVIVNANPGQAEVQKSDLFKIKHANVISNLSKDVKRVSDVRIDNLPAGDYAVQGVAQSYGISANFTLSAGAAINYWLAAGTTLTAGTTFAANTKLKAGTVIKTAANITFGVGATFMAGGLFAANSKFAAGTIFDRMTANVAISGAGTNPVMKAGSILDARTVQANNAYTFVAGTVLEYRTAAGAALRQFNVGAGAAATRRMTAIVAAIGAGNIPSNQIMLQSNYRLTATYTFTSNAVGNNVSSVSFTTVAAISTAFRNYSVATVGVGNAIVNRGTLVDAYTNAVATRVSTASTYTIGYASKLNANKQWVNGMDAAGRQVRIVNAAFASTTNVNQVFGITSGVGLTNKYGIGISITGRNSTSPSRFSGTANILLEVKNVDLISNIVTFKAVAQVTFADGSSQSFVSDDLQLKEGEGVKWTAFGVAGDIISLDANAISAAGYSVGDKLTLGVMSLAGTTNGTFVNVLGSQNTQWGGSWGTGFKNMTYMVNSSIAGKDVHFRTFYLNTMNGQTYDSDIAISFRSDYTAPTATAIARLGNPSDLATFKATYVGQTALLDTQLRDIDKFWDANGKFMLDDPKTLTITQGDGKSTTLTIYSNDTMGDVVRKFNEAVAKGLKQGDLVSNANNFATFVQKGTANTSEAVQGTMVIRTAINGMGGTLNISGDEEVMNALSLNIIQQAKENEFYVSIQDAHSGQSVASSVKVAGNYAVGILHPNLDFEFDPSADMSVIWNDKSKKYETRANDGSEYTTIIHVADNTSVFQIGANEGEDMAIDIGDMGTRSLGLHKVLLTNRASAARSITIIDSALNTLATQRSKLGAYQNRLEYTISSLTTASENLTASESRIRDLDMAKEMMNFTKLNILMQAGQSMLSQANQMPQGILQLLRG